MRKRRLAATVHRFLSPGARVVAIAFMWRVHRAALPFGIGAAALTAAAGVLAGFDTASSVVAVSLAGVALAVVSSTDYRVLAMTDSQLVFMRGSRFREAATGIIDVLPLHVEIEIMSTNLVAGEWRIDQQRFMVAKRHQAAMRTIASTCGQRVFNSHESAGTQDEVVSKRSVQARKGRRAQ